MAERQDPVEAESDGTLDLYDVATWDRRTSLDRVASGLYRLAVAVGRWAVILVALLILIAIGGLSAITDPEIGVLTALSALPALALAAYVWRSDVTTSEPLSLLVATFLLGVLTANFAAVANGLLQGWFRALGAVGTVAFFYLVVGPVEETVKLLAVRLYAYNSDDGFDAVVDGAVYGAMAGLGFATIENALYITQRVDQAALDFGFEIIGMGGGITAVRAFAGPGHVIYSAFAGYYLGLAKFNRENRGPIVIKGLLIAAFIHATYNATAGLGVGLIDAYTPLGYVGGLLAYVLVYDGVFGYVLYRKIKRYRDAYRTVHADDPEETDAERVVRSEPTEFE